MFTPYLYITVKLYPKGTTNNRQQITCPTDSATVNKHYHQFLATISRVNCLNTYSYFLIYHLLKLLVTGCSTIYSLLTVGSNEALSGSTYQLLHRRLCLPFSMSCFYYSGTKSIKNHRHHKSIRRINRIPDLFKRA
jgi:hypothetical protein